MTSAAVLLSIGCHRGDDTSGDAYDPNCDPLVPTACALPFPSTYFMQEDAQSPTGWRVHLGATTLPVTANHYQMKPDYWNERDGFANIGPLVTHLPGASLAGTADHDHIGDSILPGSDTLLVDVDTGEVVPHWVEREMYTEEADEQVTILQPAVTLAYGHRYAVGIRGLTAESGGAWSPSEAFLSLRDQAPTDDPRVSGRQALYDDVIFPTLEKAGMPRADVQLAWDFVVGSKVGITGKLVAMRDDAMDRAGGGPAYTIARVDEPTLKEDANVAKVLHGTFVSPYYTDGYDPGTFLSRDENGMPTYQGDTDVKFTIVIPRSVADAGVPAPLVQYGHGFFGAQDEVESGYLEEAANHYGWILFCVDWTGMKVEDQGTASLMLVQDPDDFAILPERTLQGFIEQMVAVRMMKGSMAKDAAIGALIDPTRVWFYGNSQGSILGGAYVAASPDIERATLGVGGTPYHLLIGRSVDFEPFFLVADTMFPNAIDLSTVLAVYQTLWDSGDTSGYLPALGGDDPIDGTPPKQILMQDGIGDAQVSNLGAQILARGIHATLLDPPAREVWGLETQKGPTTGNALVEFDYGLPPVPFEAVPPPEEFDPHEWPRREPAGQEQIDLFFRTGSIENTCGGVCEGVANQD